MRHIVVMEWVLQKYFFSGTNKKASRPVAAFKGMQRKVRATQSIILPNGKPACPYLGGVER